ncbi:hypothetical protein [Algoriphagus sp.]|uniref:hypothetical protein n=1 Tax=Algoriphagus sp. TaxID=1872435 RepID=UPI00328B3C12
MKKRFIICLNESTPEQEKVFIEYIKSQKLGWWHWLTNIWLISDRNGKLDCEIIRDKAMEVFAQEYVIVIELSSNHDTWAGYGPSSDKKNMFKWLEENWEKQ